jgi:DNA (cytosine-5)-methyltransferase 1
MGLRYLDVCSGYSAFTQAADGLGFECAGYAEIEAFPSALLGHHYGASRARYMPDPEADGIDAKERKTRLGLIKSMRSLSDDHFGNRVINFGDFTQIREDDVGPVNGLVGGTPCQAFSIAGKRLGLDDPRGNLTLEFLALAKRLRVEWLAWENVPGFLSHDEGRTMGAFLRLLGELGFGWAYRVLDAQYIRVDGLSRAVPQRRKRLIVVGYLGNAARAAAVLFERESLRGDPAPRRQAGQRVAEPLAAGSPNGSGYRNDANTAGNLVAFGGGNTAGPIDVATTTTTTSQRLDFDSETFIAEVAGTLPAGGNATGGDRQPGMGQETADTMLVAHNLLAKGNLSHQDDRDTLIPVAHSLRADGFDASEDGTGRGTPIIPVPPAVAYSIMPQNSGKDYKARKVDVAQPLMAGGPVGGNQGGDFVAQPVAYRITPNDGAYESGDITGALTTGTDNRAITLLQGWAVRRLTPTECERLMGLRDGFTLIPYRGKPASDGPRYKALGNSQARNMMRWIARGIADVQAVPAAQEIAA